MCDIVTIGDEEYETVGELRAVCPEIVFWLRAPMTPEDEDCLCGVDLTATAAVNGYQFRRGIWGATFYRD